MTTRPPVQVGDRIALTEVPDDPNPIEVGEEGTVTAVTLVSFRAHDSFHQVEVAWDSGRSLSLTVPADKFTIIGV